MAITIKQKEKFIELRAQGLSFDSISEKLIVSKPTLIKLQLELNNEISNLRYLIYESLIEKYKLTVKQRLEILCKHLEKINKEIEKKDFSDLTLKELIFIREKLQSELTQLLDGINYYTGEYQNNTFGGFDMGETEKTFTLL